MKHRLKKIIKSLNGKLIGIGIEDKDLINEIDNNDKIVECNLIGCLLLDDDEDGKTKKIRIGKIRKKFKKNKPDYIIYNLESIETYNEQFIYDAIYLTNKEIYVYSNIENEILVRRYKRFCNVELIKEKDGVIYKITQIKKINRFNEFYNKTKDSLINLVDFISNLLS